jgi:hypothetical protein
METATAPRTLTLAGVRAEMYASHASVEADPMAADDPPDTLTQAMHHEAYFILDRYQRNEGWDTTDKQIRAIHEDLCAAGIGAARGAMIELAAARLKGTRRLEE